MAILSIKLFVVFRWQMPWWRTIVMVNGHLIVLMWMSWWYHTIQQKMVLSDVFLCFVFLDAFGSD